MAFDLRDQGLLTSTREAAELILKATYGYTTEAHGADPLVDLVDEVMEQFSQAFVPGKWAVDLIPALQYLPEWFPGTAWKQTAKLWNQTMTDVINIPFEYARLLQDNKNGLSFVSKALAQHDEEKGGPSSADIDTIKLAAVSLYTGGMRNQCYREFLNADLENRCRYHREHHAILLPRNGHAPRCPSQSTRRARRSPRAQCNSSTNIHRPRPTSIHLSHRRRSTALAPSSTYGSTASHRQRGQYRRIPHSQRHNPDASNMVVYAR